MTENQKLREALQVAEAALSDIGDADREPGDDLAWCERRAAQSLPLIRQALALPTAAPVGEREAFELVIVEAGGSGAIRRWPNEKGESYENARVQDYRQGWLWGIEWQARAALSAGDAGDVQRLDFIEEHCRCDPKMDGQHVWWPTSFNTAQLLKGPTLREAIDNAIRARKGNT